MESFPAPPARRGSTSVATVSSSFDPILPPPIPSLTFGDAATTRSASPVPSRPRRSSKRGKTAGDASSPMQFSWSSSSTSSAASSTGTIGAEELRQQERRDRTREVQTSLQQLEGTAKAVANEQRIPSPAPSNLREPFREGGAKAGSPRRPLSAAHKRSNSSLNKLSRMSSEQLRELARGKRQVGVGSSVSSRTSIATLSSIMSSTGDSIYEDAVEYWTQDEEGDEEGESSGAEGAIVMVNGAHPLPPSTPPPKQRFADDGSQDPFPPPLASPPIFRPVFGAASKLDMEQQKRLHHRRRSLQAEYSADSSSAQQSRHPLEQSDTMIPLRRFSSIPKAFKHTSPNRRHSYAHGFGSPSSSGDHSSSTIVPPSPESRRSSFQLKPLVLTPQRTLIASSPTSAGSPSLARRRLSEQFTSMPSGRSLNRNGSLTASSGRPTSPFGGRTSPLSYGAAPIHGPSRRRSMGYVESSTLLGRRDSGSSSQGGHTNGAPAPVIITRWGRTRSASEDTGSTQTTAKSSLMGEGLHLLDGESPDSSRSSWSEGKEPEGRGSPALNDREWEQEYHKRSVTPLGVLEEGRQVEQWDQDGMATKRRTMLEEDEDDAFAASQKHHNEQQAAWPLPTAPPLIELSQPSPVKDDFAVEIAAPLASGLPHPVASSTEEVIRSVSPPSAVPPPDVPVANGLESRRPSAKSIKSIKSVKSSKSAGKAPKIRKRYDEHWDGTPFVESSPSTIYDSPSLRTRTTREDDIPAIPTYRPIQIRTTSDSSVRSARAPLKLERTDISPIQQQATFPTHEMRHTKSFNQTRLQNGHGAKGTRSSAELRKGVRELAWPPEGQTKKVSAGPRISTPAYDSDDESPPSPILYYKEEDFDRRDSYLPRRPNLEPRDPRAQVHGPNSFLEVLLSTEPPSSASKPRRSAFDSLISADDPIRWSHHSTATSQMTSHIPGQRQDEDSSPSSSPTKGTLAKRIFGSFSKEKRRKSESNRSALEGTSHTPRPPVAISAGGQKTLRPISIPSRPPGSPPPSLPPSVVTSRRGSATSDTGRPISTTSNGFIPRQAPISPLFGHPSQLDSSSQEELSDFDPRLASPPPSRHVAYVPRRGPVDDHVEEKLMDYVPGRDSMSSAGSDPHLSSHLNPRAYQLPPGLGGPTPAPILLSSSRPRSQHRKAKPTRSGSISSDQEYSSRSLQFGGPVSPTSSQDGSYPIKTAPRRASAPHVGGARRGSDDASHPLPERRRGSTNSQLDLQRGVPYGVRDVMRSQVSER